MLLEGRCKTERLSGLEHSETESRRSENKGKCMCASPRTYSLHFEARARRSIIDYRTADSPKCIICDSE